MNLAMISKLSLAVVSDIHLGSKRNKTTDIINNLVKAFPSNDETSKLDIIFLAGDVFDRLLDYPDVDAMDINIWIYDFLTLCSRFNIIVRILEGTPSHDRFQSQAFLNVAHISKLPIDLKYVKTLSIEYIEELDINVLYVPDEWETTTDKTLDQVKELLQNKGLEKVDFAIMHGSFDYQVPPHLKKVPKHDSQEYLNIVKHYIFIGHIHNFTFHDRIIAQGSFDRLAHGEEGPKGHVRAVIKNDQKEFFFIENESAKIYKTFKCYSLNLEETLIYLKKMTESLPDNSCVRVEADKEHIIFSNMNELVSMYPTITWTKLQKSEENDQEIIETDLDDDYTQITINKDNIESLLMYRITSLNLDSSIVLRSERLLRDII